MRPAQKSSSILPAALAATALSAILVFTAGCKIPETKSISVNKGPRTAAERLRDSPTVAAVNASGFDLLRRLDAEKAPQTGNVFISPFSIMQAMTMVTNGAGGETQSELRSGLHLNGVELSTVNTEQKALRTLLSSTQKTSENSLLIANSLWVDRRLGISPGFATIAGDFYGAPVRILDFQNTIGAASEINQWVDANTQGKIKTLFTAQELAGPPPADVVLANAVYFKAAWLTPFSETDTNPKPFTLESGERKTLPMMQQASMEGFEDGVAYYKGDGFAMASLAYDGKISRASRSMVLLLPDAPDGLRPLLGKLTPENWSDWQKKLSFMIEMDLWLPRFTLNYEASLIPSLQQMGVRRAFDPVEADFAPMGLTNHFISLSVL